MAEQKIVDDVFGQLDGRASERETVNVGDVLDAFGRRAHGPALFIIGVLVVSPLGAIPGASILFALIVILLAGQYALRDQPPWLPNWLTERKVRAEKARSALQKSHPYAKKLELLLSERRVALTKAPWTWLWALVLLGLAGIMFPLALIPAGVAPPGAMIALMGLAITARDGLALALSGSVGTLIMIGAPLALL
jgi:hypothetical protein